MKRLCDPQAIQLWHVQAFMEFQILRMDPGHPAFPASNVDFAHLSFRFFPEVMAAFPNMWKLSQ